MQMIMSYEWRRMWMAVVIEYYKVLSQHFPGETKEKP
jgi:hypothetical protein